VLAEGRGGKGRGMLSGPRSGLLGGRGGAGDAATCARARPPPGRQRRRNPRMRMAWNSSARGQIRGAMVGGGAPLTSDARSDWPCIALLVLVLLFLCLVVRCVVAACCR
jgi:hypothetical protein